MNRRFSVVGVSASTPLAEAAPALLLSKAEPLFALEAAARGGADADAVHDMRVASRRLREAMRLLAPVYPSRDFRSWYKRVRRVTRALGPVRDSDVFVDEFSRLGRDLGDEGRRAVAFMVGFRMGQRAQELTALNAELSKVDLTSGRRSLARLAGSVASSATDVPLAGFAHAAIAERAAAVFGAQPLALDVDQIARQHELRIHYKRLRYAVEVFAPCYADDFDALHDTLTAFQDTLGELHDMHVFLEMMRAPDRVTAARQAGVTGEGIAEVESLLEARAAECFSRFVTLAATHPAEALLPELLLPLARPAVPAPEESHAEWDEVAVVSPVVVGDEPWAEGWDGLAAAGDTDAGMQSSEAALILPVEADETSR